MEKSSAKILVILVVSIIMLTISTVTSPALNSFCCNKNYEYYGNAINGHASLTSVKLNLSNIITHTSAMAGYSSRMTGYSGYYSTLEYVKAVLKSCGLEPSYQRFKVLVPISMGANITTSSGEVFKAFPLEPNLVALSSTPPEGIRGPLVYAGTGIRDFDGKPLNGSILLMDMDSQDEWVTAASLGVRAVVFFSRSPITWQEAQYKRLNVPFNFPRVYVEGRTAERLLEIAQSKDNEILLKSTVVWREVEAENIFALVPGEDFSQYKSEIIVLATHVDASSVVLEKAPGAREAMNTALLLELARFFSTFTPKRTILFAFLSGYHQNLAGAREFVEANFERISREIRLFIGVDLGVRGRRIALAYAGWAYNYYLAAGGGAGGLTAINRLEGIYNVINNKVMLGMGELGNYIDNSLTDYPVHGAWEAYMPFPFKFDHEAYNQAGGTGFTIFTSYDRREYWRTPFDTVDTVDFGDLSWQSEIVLSLASNIIGLDDIPLHPNSVPTRYSQSNGGAGFATLTGKVVKYDFKTAWYKVLNKTVLLEEYGPDASVLIHVYLYHPSSTYPLLFDMILKPDEDGSFIIHGVPTITTWWYTTQYTSAVGQITASFLSVEPYIISLDGSVLAAPDFGRYGSPHRSYMINNGTYTVDRAAVFDCGTIVLFDLLEYQYRNPLKRELINEQSLAGIMASNIVYKATGHVPSDFQFVSASSTSNVITVHVPVEEKVEVIWSNAQSAYPNVILNNRSSGYILKRGEQIIIHNSLLENILSISSLVEERLGTTSSFNVHSMLAEPFHAEARRILMSAIEKLGELRYSVFKAMLKTAWEYEFLAYSYSRQFYDDIINTITFFSALLIPASILLAALLFGSPMTALKRLLTTISVFSTLIIILFLFHPGFHLASSTMMVLVGFVSAILLLPVEMILLGLLGDYIKQFRKKTMGLHFAEMSRTSAALVAFSMGVENMRKRKTRTILTCVSLILTVFSLTALTSLPSVIMYKEIAVGGDSPYSGIMLRNEGWQPFSPRIIQDLSEILNGSATVHARVWLYPRLVQRGVSGGGMSAASAFELNSESGTSFIGAILGVSSNDPLIKSYLPFLLKNNSFWFLPVQENAQVCILSESLGRSLNVKQGDMVKLQGSSFTVIGFFDDSLIKSIKDLDGRSILPIDVTKPGQMSLEPSLVMLIPYGTSIRLGGNPTIVALEFDDSSLIEDCARRLALELSLNPYYGTTGGPVKQASTYIAISLLGIQNIFILLAICMFAVFNMMLGIIEERTREIGTLSAIGLSPLHVSFMFLAEIIDYAIISATLGYILGVIGISATQKFNVMPGVVLNYSSSVIIIVLSMTILSTIAASLLPVRKAARLVTPSLERKWKVTTKPQGTEWTIPLPFSSPPEELPGVLAFIHEFISSHSREGVGSFVSSDTVITDIQHGTNTYKGVKSRINLPPYDQGLTQDVYLIASLDDVRQKYDFIIHTVRLSGIEGTWKRSNFLFVNSIRKQLLIWRTLRQEEREEYIKRGRSIMGVSDT
ncbi:MAG: FtsX-like permease family protein [Thermoproteota archaeon]|nr:M28 family peptidase [Candidatus Brockarchaeota archaeon]